MLLQSSKLKPLLLLISTEMLVFIGLYYRNEIPSYMGYIAAVFFGCGFFVAFLQLLPGATQLEITNEGIRYSVLFRKFYIPWNRIAYFYELTMQDGKTKKVGWHYSEEVVLETEARQGHPVNMEIPHGILPDNFGKTASELVDILNSFPKAKQQG